MELGELYAGCVLIFIMLFQKNSETGVLTRHIRTKHSRNQAQQTQISTVGGTINTNYNRQRGKTNLTKYIILAVQSFNFAENEAFINFIRTAYNPEYYPLYKDTIRTEMFRVVEEIKQLLLAIFLL